MFGADANTFNPQRWLEPRAKDMEKYMVQVSTPNRGQQLANPNLSILVVRCWLQLMPWPKLGPHGSLKGHRDFGARF